MWEVKVSFCVRASVFECRRVKGRSVKFVLLAVIHIKRFSVKLKREDMIEN